MKFTTAAVASFLATAQYTEAFVPTTHRPTAFSRSASFIRHSTINNEVESIRQKVETSGLSASGAVPNVNNRESMSTQLQPELERIAASETRAATATYLEKYKGQSGAAIVYSKLVEHGVEVVNGFSGGAVLPLLDQFHSGHPRHAGDAPIRWITNSNENSAGHIAEGYGKSQPVNGRHLPVGVVVATSGPGLTNLITPLQDAICDGVPVVALCGQAATVAPKDAFQSSPAVELTAPCTKWSYQIKSAAELPLVMDYAFYVARNGRPGPVFVDLPKDLQNQILDDDLIKSFLEFNLHDMPVAVDNRFVRLTTRSRPDGTMFKGLSMGTKDRRFLPFEMKKVEAGFELSALTDVDETMTRDGENFHADHSPTNIVTKHEAGDTKSDPLDVDSAIVQDLLMMIRQAKKPVILAGQGCNDASEELAVFAERLKIPVATTLHALGCYDERKELALNMVGMHGHPTPNFMFQESDLIICIGSRFDDRITGRMSDYIPEARRAAEEHRGGIIHVDIRRTEHSKQLTPTYFVHSTGKNFLKVMNDGLDATFKLIPGTATTNWMKRMKELQRNYPVKVPHFPTEQVKVHNNGQESSISRTKMSAQSVVSELNRQLLEAGEMDNAIFTTGVGVHQMIAAQLITWTQPRQMLSSGSLGTMGVALGYAIGAKLANGRKMVIAVDGDGSFNMTFTELKTLAEEKIPVKIMVIDNDGQMMVEYWQRLFHDNRLLAVRNSANPDYVTLAKAFGIKSVYCDAQEDLEGCMKEFLFSDPDEPVLFHVRVERTPCLPLVAPGQPLDDMILEDVEVNVDGSAAPS